MDNLKNIIKKHFSSFVFFYRYLRSRIFVAFGFSVLVTVLDSLGLSMFLPLLQVVNNQGVATPDGMGNLGFIIEGFERLGIEMTIGFVLLFMVIFFFFKGIAYFFSASYIVTLQQFFIKSLRINMLDSLNRMSFKNFITSDAGRIQNTMSGEVDGVARSYNSYFYTFEQSIMVFVYMCFAFFVNVQFAVLVSIGGVITNLLYKLIYQKTKQASLKLTASNHSYQGLIMQHISNFKYLKATGRVQEYSNHLKTTIDEIEKTRRSLGILSSVGSAAREPLLITVVATVILIQTQFLGGSISTILVSLLFFYRALTSLVQVQLHWNEFLSVSGSLENMKTFTQTIMENQEKNGNQPFTGFKDEIRIEDLSFSYGNMKVLKNINLSIKKNSSIAFVGESGSGKTTLVNIIVGLLLKDKGTFYVDGSPFETLDRYSYQDRIGYITQDPVLFNDTIFNNVTFWEKKTPDSIARFQHAIEQASLSKFLDQLPDGMDSKIGNNGINLSGGQKQRVSIARELYRDIDILIMDEATSSLDSETEYAIQQSIDTLQGKYTLIIVAHRLSTIRGVDHIVCMNNGRIEGEGSFSGLVENHARFKKMVELQEI